MKLSRFIGYFLHLRSLLGFKATCTFILAYIRNKINPPSVSHLVRIPVGTYVFHFPSLAYFEGLFSEIFFRRHIIFRTPTNRFG